MKLKKTILTDADGVLLNWDFAFNIWMQEHGFQTVKGYQFMYDMAERYGIPKEQVKKQAVAEAPKEEIKKEENKKESPAEKK